MSGSETGTQPASGRAWDVLARSAALRERDEAPVLLREFVAFRLAGDPYAVPIERVREIVRMRSITSVPRVPPEVRGVISLRGEIVQVVDLRRRLAMPPSETTRASRIIVIHGEDGDVAGVLVDEVTEVLRVDEDAVQSPPSGESEYVSALCERGGEFVSVMSLDRVLDLGAA
jgi:purine-binding chemotaxis protein CheW